MPYKLTGVVVVVVVGEHINNFVSFCVPICTEEVIIIILPSLHSYMNLMGFVDAQFPPLVCATDSAVKGQQDVAEDYSTFNYWREPLSVELPFELPELSL